MKIKTRPFAKIAKALAAVLLAASLVSCDLFIEALKESVNDEIGDINDNEFYAQNTATSKYYITHAEFLVEGDYCQIWAEKDSGITHKKAREIANEYDNHIRSVIVDAFSKKNFSLNYMGSKVQFSDMLDFANWLVANRNDSTRNGEGKLTILLLDIKDGYSNRNESYTAGYFFSGDFYPRGPVKGSTGKILGYSNGRDMIYIDTYPSLNDSDPRFKIEDVYGTFAHELQHLINYATRVWMSLTDSSIQLMDTWIDEGLSSQAEYLYLDDNPAGKVERFSNDVNGTIAKGNNFFVWGNHVTSKQPLAILDDYSTVYLFFRWLYLQAQAKNGLQSTIFRDIVSSEYYDFMNVTNAAKEINPAWGNWETLLRTWFAANYNPKNSQYGYNGDSYLQENIKIKRITGSSVSLYPGEGVYSVINNNSFSVGNTAGNIRYAGLARNTAAIDTASPYSGDTLLTFNANSDCESSSESGRLTGVAAVSTASRTLAEDTQAGLSSGPYRLDARDLWGRNHELDQLRWKLNE